MPERPFLRYADRSRVRDACRRAWIDTHGDPDRAKDRAMKIIRMESIIGAILLAVFVNLVAGWIADFINDWLSRGVAIPAPSYQPEEPGYDFDQMAEYPCEE